MKNNEGMDLCYFEGLYCTIALCVWYESFFLRQFLQLHLTGSLHSSHKSATSSSFPQALQSVSISQHLSQCSHYVSKQYLFLFCKLAAVCLILLSYFISVRIRIEVILSRWWGRGLLKRWSKSYYHHHPIRFSFFKENLLLLLETRSLRWYKSSALAHTFAINVG